MFRVRDILYLISDDSKIEGSIEAGFDKLGDAEHIDENTLDWIHPNRRDPMNYLISTKAKVIIAPLALIDKYPSVPNDKTIIFSDNPMLLFTRVAYALFVERPASGIHPSAVIHPDAKIGENVHICPFSYIGKCEIGDNCVIHSHVSIEDNVRIGQNVLIKNGARIGQPGFGFVRNEVGEYEKFPQLGKVIIEDYVEIGANTCIDRGALSTTRIGRGTKIDNMVQIAHNVRVGENCVIAGYSGLGGSSIIGNNVWIGPKSSIKHGVEIGDGAFISTGSIVIHKVKPHEDVMGYPAEDKNVFLAKKRQLSKMIRSKENATIS